MKKYLVGALLILILLLISVYGSKDSTKNISKTLGVSLSKGRVVQEIDSHGGFHGDGMSFKVITFRDQDSDLVKQIRGNEWWCELPFTENLSAVVYGEVKNNYIRGSLVTNEDGEQVFPAVENGYYFFYDRHTDSKDRKDDTDLLNRYSYNFTIAIYDSDHQVLYYYELDT